MLLKVTNLVKSYAAITVLSNVSFIINEGDRTGIVGSNGVGKSTLLRILAGQEAADSGSVSFAPSIEVGYLPQATPEFYGRTIDDLIMESLGNLRQLEYRMRQLEDVMAQASGDELKAVLEEYSEVSTKFQERGGYDVDYRIDMVMAGLKLSHLERTREVHTLSGGEKARIGLAVLLLQSPDILLLDEPTNHLDVASLDWLEEYLSRYPGGVLAVSHDRRFLNRTVTRILEIDEDSRELKRYEGNYDAFMLAKQAERAKWEEEYERQQEEVKELRQRIRETSYTVGGHNRAARDNEKYGFNARGERAQAAVSRSIRLAREQLSRIEENAIAKPPEVIHINPRFKSEPLQSGIAIQATDLNKSFGDRQILHDVNFTISASSRIVLVGSNGAGKSTLLKVIMGLDQLDGGEIRIAPSARLGYLPQEPNFPDLRQTALEFYRQQSDARDEDIIASLLRYGLLRYEDLNKPLGRLSLGQRRKLEIAQLIAEEPNMLLLDEPTNHISLDVLEGFEAAIIEFPGPIIAVSHDRWFSGRFNGEVWELLDGAISRYPPGYMVRLGSD